MGPATEPKRALEELRARLASIDRSLVLSLCAREETQREILALKQAHSLPLIDLPRERDVRRRARAWALELGGDPDLAAQVVAAALDSGKRRFFLAGPAPGPSGGPVVVFLQPARPSEAPRPRAADPLPEPLA